MVSTFTQGMFYGLLLTNAYFLGGIYRILKKWDKSDG